MHLISLQIYLLMRTICFVQTTIVIETLRMYISWIHTKKKKNQFLFTVEKQKRKEKPHDRRMFCVNRKKFRLNIRKNCFCLIHILVSVPFIRIRSFFRIPRETENWLLKPILTIHHCRLCVFVCVICDKNPLELAIRPQSLLLLSSPNIFFVFSCDCVLLMALK